MRVNFSSLNNFLAQETLNLAQEYSFKLTKGNYGVDLKKRIKSAVCQACFGLDQKWEGIVVLGHTVYIGYPEVDNIANPILVKNDLLGSSVFLDDAYTFSAPFYPKHDVGKNIPIQRFEDLLPIIEKFKLFFLEDALPYFEKWNDLRTVSEFLNDIPQMEVHKYMSMGIFKKAVIWKLCNNPRYEEYMNWLYTAMRERYSKFPNGDINYKRTADAITELKEILDKTDPIYL